MKAMSLIERNPYLKSITLELTPREAFLLCLFMGSHNKEEILKHCNTESNITYFQNPPFDCPDSVKGKMTSKESEAIIGIYNQLAGEFYAFKNTQM